jgi:translation initiation factor 1
MQIIDKYDDEDEIVHIRKQARNGKKCMTIIEGLADDLDIKKISKHLAKLLQCSSTILLKDDKVTEVIKLSGDKIKEVKQFLIKEQIYKEKNITIHG